MSDIDLIRFTVTIFLGGLSIGFAIFSFISSFRNNKNSQEALGKISEISGEIKSQLSTSISNQKDYTNKMLDSIISNSNYAENNLDGLQSTETVEEILQLKVNQIESKLTGIIDEKLNDQNNSVSEDVKNELNKLRRIVQDLDIESPNNELPFETKEQLIKWRKFPAFYLLIGSMVKELKQGNTDIKKIAKKYYYPKGWENAIDQLEKFGFISSNNNKISIPIEIEAKLNNWVDENWNLILKLKTNFKNKEGEDTTSDYERELGGKFKI